MPIRSKNTCESNFFAFELVGCARQDELVDLPALGCHVLLYYEHMNLLCTLWSWSLNYAPIVIYYACICDLLC
jgi:hypothetical protein